MPTLLTTRSPDLLEHAAQVHRAHGYDFPKLFDEFYRDHYVFKGPDFFLMGLADPKDPDAWLVWWAESSVPRSPADMVALFIRFMPHYRSRVGWARALKGNHEVKYYSTARLLRLIQAKASSA